MPIYIEDVTLLRGAKTCFTSFSATLHEGDKLGIIGRNGSGKSSLLKLLLGEVNPSEGNIRMPQGISVGYVPQVIEEPPTLSGGERFQKALSLALQKKPDLLLLDEPTNHLDLKNKKALLKMLHFFQGTLLIVSHDEALLRTVVSKLWILEEEEVHHFNGNYESYLQEAEKRQQEREVAFHRLKKEKKSIHLQKMKKQEQNASKTRNKKKLKENNKMLRDKMKETSEKTNAKQDLRLKEKREKIHDSLRNFDRKKEKAPTFTFPLGYHVSQTLITIQDGFVQCKKGAILLEDFYFSLQGEERLWLQGPNGSGKSTLCKTLLMDEKHPTGEKPLHHYVREGGTQKDMPPQRDFQHPMGETRRGLWLKKGKWSVPPREQIGYLDQHYSTLVPHKSVFDHLQEAMPTASDGEIRKVLSEFLFLDHEEVEKKAEVLSGGEKVRLSLAQIAVKPTRLLILDEVTNNMDLTTKNYLVGALQGYKGGIILISHDEAFAQNLGITTKRVIKNRKIETVP